MMSNLTRFFNTFHHLSAPDLSAHAVQSDMELSLSPQQCAILLSLSRHKLPLYLQCPTFSDMLRSLPATLHTLPHFSPQAKAALASLHGTQIESVQNLNALFEALSTLQALLIEQNGGIFEELMPHFAQLNLASILDNAEFSLFASLKAHAHHTAPSQEVSAPASSFHAARLHSSLSAIHAHIASIAPEWQSKLEAIANRLSSEHFSIGVSGVLSAGKSTFLNALLSQEVLGSSSVPETANLTILRYGEALRGRVHFWSKQQWEELKAQSAHDENLTVFIKASQEAFGSELESHLANPAKVQDIEASELSAYTSANHPSKLCNLIQKVELFVPLAFLQHSVEIVDTPGLDDPITKREDITRAYLEHCDVLIHVMNASCAATQVDIDFILESLLLRHVSRLLIVLTRIDLLSKDQLEASLNYTRTSLINQLKKARYQGNVQDLINRIDFIPLAGYTALLYRTNRIDEAKQSGLSLEECGITRIEDYLSAMLLGEDSLKMRDMLHIAHRATLSLAQEALAHKDIEHSLLNASEQELEGLLERFKEEQDALEAKALAQKIELDSQGESLGAFLDTLLASSAASVRKATSMLGERLYEDFLYESKNGKKLEAKAVQTSLELGLRDCLDDIAREYKYKLGAKLAQIQSVLTSSLRDSEGSGEDIKSALAPSLPRFKPQGFAHLTAANLQDIIAALSGRGDKLRLSAALERLCDELEGFLQEQNALAQEAITESFTRASLAYTAHIEEQIAASKAKIAHTLAKRQEALDSKSLQNLAQQRQALQACIQDLQTNLGALR